MSKAELNKQKNIIKLLKNFYKIDYGELTFKFVGDIIYIRVTNGLKIELK